MRVLRWPLPPVLSSAGRYPGGVACRPRPHASLARAPPHRGEV